MDNLDNVIEVLDSVEAKESDLSQPRAAGRSRVPIGTVEYYFGKINVVAIKLEASLMVGDVIEIGTEEEAVRQKVGSMQIDRKDVIEAYEGDSVGIKVKWPVSEGSAVYKIAQG